MGDLKETPLKQYHIELGAKMVPFAGWNMPVQYPGGILAEHKQTRTGCSIFDISHMGEFRVAGQGAPAALDALFPRPVSDLKIGACRYNFLLDEQGGVLDDLIVYRMGDEDFFIVVNAGTIASDAEWIQSRLPGGIEFNNLSAELSKIDIQGPRSAEVMEKIGLSAAELPGYYKSMIVDIDGIRCILSRTGYTGELGFEIYFNAEYADQMWDLLLETEIAQPAGLGARDTLRLEMGYSLYGHELRREWTPIDSGAGALLKLDDGRDFVGKAALLANPPTRRAVAVRLDGRRAARADAKVYRENGDEVGFVTSGAFCPTLECSAALCSLEYRFDVKEGDKLFFDGASAKFAGTVTTTPFLKETSLRVKLS